MLLFLGFSQEASIVITLLLIIISLAIIFYWVRFVFDIRRQLWNQAQQINLLIRIAIVLGVHENDEQLSDIRDKNNGKIPIA